MLSFWRNQIIWNNLIDLPAGIVWDKGITVDNSDWNISDPTADAGGSRVFVEPADYPEFLLLVSGGYVMWECIGTGGCAAQVPCSTVGG